MDTFKILYTMLGGLGIFFYGMKSMSDALQQAAGDYIKKIINSLTSNRYMAVVVGMIVTMLVQSSSVTTVMVVGFVNAGLMQLTQAIGVILGSNIGTTITGWIISIKVGKYGLLFIGLGIFPALFSKKSKYQNIGKALFGIGLIFLGLETMSAAFKPLRTNPEFREMIGYFSGEDYFSYFASILTGCMLTVIIQSSSAMLGITIALASTGIIGFHTAAALVLGENIGTTITAILASVGTTTNAKRAARAHAIFNVFGVLVIFSILPFWVDLIEWIVPGVADDSLADGSRPNIAAHIATSHTLFNVAATILFVPFLGILAKVVTKITPDKSSDKESTHLVMLGDNNEILPATALAQAESEVKKMKDILDRMYKVTREYLKDADPAKLEKVRSYESITDNIQTEVTLFLCRAMELPMSSKQTLETQVLIKIVDEFESIADYLERLVNYKARFHNAPSSGESTDDLDQFMDKVWDFFQLSSRGLEENKVISYDEVFKKSEELRVEADKMRDMHLGRISQRHYEPRSAMTYSDMVVAMRKIRAHALNVAEAYSKFRN